MEDELAWLIDKFNEYADIFAQEYSGAGTSWEEVERLKIKANKIFMDIEQDAFASGFYAGAAQERKDGTPYPFIPAEQCFREWVLKGRKWSGKYP